MSSLIQNHTFNPAKSVELFAAKKKKLFQLRINFRNEIKIVRFSIEL